MDKTLILKISQAITLVTGLAFTSFNLFSFTVVKSGYYFKDNNQYWLAFGVSLLAIYYLIKNWKNL
ncbi:MAG: hypothetical protein BMS9Abin31_0176 [Gammaproteobacteria bacterium]|nr:MAG: hypothetical protein BMS9Abin31_0176 [Gammaproteobacteria bacterium]